MAMGSRSERASHRRLSPRAWAATGLVGEVTILVAMTVWAFPTMWRVSNAIFDEAQSAGPELGVTLSEVSDNPVPLWDETVTVSARVDRFVGPHTMVIGNDAPIVGDRVVVVRGPPLAVPLGLEDRPWSWRMTSSA